MTFNKCPNCGNTPLAWYEDTAVCDCCGYVYDSKGVNLYPNQSAAGNNYVNEVQTFEGVRPAPIHRGNKHNFPFAAAAALLAVPALILVICIAFVKNGSSKTGTEDTGNTIVTGEWDIGQNGAVAIATDVTRETAAETVALPSRIQLTSMEPYTTSPNGWGFPFADICSGIGSEDIFGNTYSFGFRAWHKANSTGPVSATYRLDGEYSSLRFTLAIPKADRGNRGSASVYVYADGELVYERTDITSDIDSAEVTVPLNHCRDMTIEMYATEVSAFETVRPMICDPVLCR